MDRLKLALILLVTSGCAGSRNFQPQARLESIPTPALAAESSHSLASAATGLVHQAQLTAGVAPVVYAKSLEAKQLVFQSPTAPESHMSLGSLIHESPPIAIQSSDPIDSANPELSLVTPEANGNSLAMNLPTALAMIDGQHPAVGFAKWRVQEAYARLSKAEALWLPSIQAGVGFHRHDGNYQASSGDIVDVNRNSFQYGLGTGAVGAGTTQRPGLVAQFHLADAIFQPKVAEKNAWAQGHMARAVTNERLLDAAIAYTELIESHQDARIVEESMQRVSELSKITSDFASAGEGLQADADRMQTERSLVESRLVGARERMAVASARLAQTISLDSIVPIVPMDVTVLPLEMVDMAAEQSSLIGMGLVTRPELQESQSLVAAACEAYRREKYAPFIPSVLLGFSTGGFGGGTGNRIDDVDARYDFDALMTWEVRNLGFGERAARRESSARIQQAKFAKVRVMDLVAREISEAHSQVLFRREQIQITQGAIQSAVDSYERNLKRIRDGQGLPLEVLQSAQALELAQRAYLQAVVSHNQAQLRLQWAIGWPITAIQ